MTGLAESAVGGGLLSLDLASGLFGTSGEAASDFGPSDFAGGVAGGDSPVVGVAETGGGGEPVPRLPNSKGGRPISARSGMSLDKPRNPPPNPGSAAGRFGCC